MNLFDLTDGKMNGFELAFLQSEEYADQIISKFREIYKNGDDPNWVLTAIALTLGISDEDLFPDSKKRIEDTISNYLRRF